jgi:hypothetical protein
MPRVIFQARFLCAACNPVHLPQGSDVDCRRGHRTGVEHLNGRAGDGVDHLSDDRCRHADPIPLFPIISPLAVGLRVIEVVAEGIANAVELIGTPPPIAIPAPRTDGLGPSPVG